MAEHTSRSDYDREYQQLHHDRLAVQHRTHSQRMSDVRDMDEFGFVNDRNRTGNQQNRVRHFIASNDIGTITDKRGEIV